MCVDKALMERIEIVIISWEPCIDRLEDFEMNDFYAEFVVAYV